MSRGQGTGSSGGLGFALLILAVWFLVWSWPWWLLALPAGFALLVALNGPFRRYMIRSFASESVDEATRRFRRIALRILLAAGGIAAAVCAFTVKLEQLWWWLIPLVLLTAGFRLAALHTEKRGFGRRLGGALCANVFELLLIATLTVGAYSLGVAWFRTVPLDEKTLEVLREWDHRVAEIHEWFENYPPGWKVLAGMAGVTMLLRLAAAARPALAGASTRTGWVFAKGAKWVERLSTTAALAAALTLLATGETGELGKIDLKVKDATKEYRDFESEVMQETDAELKSAILEKAWNARPQPLRAAMVRAAEFEHRREGLDGMRQEAADRFSIRMEMPAGVPDSVDLSQRPKPAGAQPSDEPAGDWTPQQVEHAAKAAEAMRVEEREQPEKKEAESGEELAKEAFGKMLPLDHLAEAAPFFEMVKVHFPVFGEFLDAVSSSMAEAGYDTMREKMVRSTVEDLKREPEMPLHSAIQARTAAAVTTIAVDQRRFETGWAARSEAELSRMAARMQEAEYRVEAQAVAKQRAQLERDANAVVEQAQLLHSAARASGRRGAAVDVAGVERAAAELKALGMEWPALFAPGRDLEERMAMIATEIPRPGPAREMANSETGATEQDLVSLIRTNYEPESPTEGLGSIDSYCRARLREIVGESSHEQEGRLRAVLGDERFGDISQEWREEQSRETARRDEQRQQLQKKEELGRGLRSSSEPRTDRRMEEYRRPMERAP